MSTRLVFATNYRQNIPYCSEEIQGTICIFERFTCGVCGVCGSCWVASVIICGGWLLISVREHPVAHVLCCVG